MSRAGDLDVANQVGTGSDVSSNFSASISVTTYRYISSICELSNLKEAEIV